MSDTIQDGVPHVPTAEEVAELAKTNPMLAALVSAKTPDAPKDVSRKMLTDAEAGVLLGLSVAGAQIRNETQAYISGVVCARLGVHGSLAVEFNAKEKWISIKNGVTEEGKVPAPEMADKTS